ncbi:alpha/beta fold hydrolase [Nocardioides sp. zg-1230]|uniref:alpha/beta fold hydrolase n=1 Tax=Nocardioides sp. zg-1230 TaxID=2736601 RepID=UPI0015531F43|nr:alpha/beta hydrolase [Nocardioides sp. zg-1230]NPC42130.1 alpha/beta hydrolase [Nocardioides sp. zg-1230]
MSAQRSTFTSPVDDLELATYEWDVSDPRGVVQVAHGLAEHSARYDRFARALNDAGYTVRAIDHRGHGASIAGEPGDFGAPGFDALIADLAAYGASVRGELPLFLVAHSMGSFAAQSVILTHSEQYAGVVLSGSTALDLLAAGMAQAEGPVGLAAFNAGFEHRTGYEWLTRDEAEVDRYVADPLCGFELPDETVPALFGSAGTLADPAALAGVRHDLPLLIASGSDDPLAGGGQLVEVLGQRYRDAGLVDVTVKLYDGARHEILNEINRDEVTTDVLAWLDAHL